MFNKINHYHLFFIVLIWHFCNLIADVRAAQQKSSIGVIYFAYHPNLKKAMEFLKRAAISVKSIKNFHPQLQITVMSNLKLSQSELNKLGFNSQVIIAKEYLTNSRQWWTRMVYLNHTPYDYTLSIDSDRVVCNDISEGFKILINGYAGKSYDLLEVSAGILPAFDNGVMFYRKGLNFNKLVEIWMRFQSSWNKYGNDQGCLANALKYIHDKKKSSMKTFNVGILPPTWQVKYIPAVGQYWGSAKAARTLVMSGQIKIVASTSCQLFLPVNDTRKRIYTYTRKPTKNSAVVYSQSECDKVLGNKCKHSEIDWKSAAYHVLDRQDYLARYYPSSDFRSLC